MAPSISEAIPFALDELPLEMIFEHGKWHITLVPNSVLEDGTSLWPVNLVLDAFITHGHREFYIALFKKGE